MFSLSSFLLIFQKVPHFFSLSEGRGSYLDRRFLGFSWKVIWVCKASGHCYLRGGGSRKIVKGKKLWNCMEIYRDHVCLPCIQSVINHTHPGFTAPHCCVVWGAQRRPRHFCFFREVRAKSKEASQICTRSAVAWHLPGACNWPGLINTELFVQITIWDTITQRGQYTFVRLLKWEKLNANNRNIETQINWESKKCKPKIWS